MTRAPNELLAGAMQDAGLSNKALARLVREVSARHGEPVGCDHTSVSRWLGGMNPRGHTARYIAEALGGKLGQTIALADVGMSALEAVDPDLGIDYASDPDSAISTLTRLWRADLDETRAIVTAPANGAAWAEASLSWIVRPAAAAEATLLAAWMTYDACVHGLAQRYFIQALRLAQAAGDALLAGSILDAMSHQATFLGRSREAANLARAALIGTQGKATATLAAHFHAMEARALAVGGDKVGAHRALGEAVRVFERRRPSDDPGWISYFDDAELSAEIGHCFRDLGQWQDAALHAGRAVSGTSDRSDFFVMMVLASAHLGNVKQIGSIEEACRVAQTALELGLHVKSIRCREYVRQFRSQVNPYLGAGFVRELAERNRANPLWSPN